MGKLCGRGQAWGVWAQLGPPQGLALGTADELSDIRVSQLGTFGKTKGNMPDLILDEQAEWNDYSVCCLLQCVRL